MYGAVVGKEGKKSFAAAINSGTIVSPTAGGGSADGHLTGFGHDEHITVQAVDPDTHVLHDGYFQRCAWCDRPIEEGQPVRRTISGRYQHDTCTAAKPRKDQSEPLQPGARTADCLVLPHRLRSLFVGSESRATAVVGQPSEGARLTG
jgi:hypothetical protein